MDIRKILVLRGPNTWANFPVLEAWVDLGDLHDTSSEEIPGFNQRLMAWLPTMIEHRCSVGERGGFFQRLERGTYPAHILEHITIELQSLAGNEVGFGKARAANEDRIYRVVVEYQDEEVARACLAEARELFLAAVHDRPYDVAARLAELRALAQDRCLGPSSMAILEAAQQRGIPYRRLGQGSLVQLGYGSKQRRICTAETDRTSAIAESIAQDKELTRQLLAAAGVPVPDGRPVGDAEDACAAAREIGAAVVVKPQYGNHGRGVTTNVSSREQVLAAYAAAREESRSIVVERYAPGDDYRLLVVGDRLVAAARREPAQVTGDGRSTVAELVDEVNRDPRRSDDHATALTKIKLDTIALSVLEQQGLGPASVPAAGQRVLIRRNANLSTGGTATDVTALVHPDLAARAVDAARVVGLDIAGVDVVARDVSQPLEAQRGVIVEVNAGPGLRMHQHPSAGDPQPVGEAIVDLLFPAGQNGRIPLIAVSGVNGKTTTTRLVAHIFRGAGRRVGMTCTDGIFLDGRRIDSGDCSGPASARAVLGNPNVDVAVLETARGGILRAGLGFDRCDVAVVTNLGEGDHLGLSDVETVEDLARVKRVVVDVVSRDGAAVLKADDPLVAAMAAHCRGAVVFFALRPDEPTIVEHRAQGGRAVFVRHDTIIVAEGEVEIPLVALANVPLTHGGRIKFQVENALSAAAAAWSLGLPRDAIRAGLESFAPDIERVPGRFNLLEINDATVIVDYGHNTSALLALVEAIEQFPRSRRTAVYTVAGDRRNCDMVRQGEILGEHFDQVILYEDHYLRGRPDGEIVTLIKQGLAGGRRVKQVDEVRGAIPAIQAALRGAAKGDLLLIQADTIDETVDFVREYLASDAAAREIQLLKAVKVPHGSVSALAAQVVD